MAEVSAAGLDIGSWIVLRLTVLHYSCTDNFSVAEVPVLVRVEDSTTAGPSFLKQSIALSSFNHITLELHRQTPPFNYCHSSKHYC